MLGFKVESIVTMKITSTHDRTNNTVQLVVEQKTMEVTQVTITLVKTYVKKPSSFIGPTFLQPKSPVLYY